MCLPPEDKVALEKKYPNWPPDEFAHRIPKHDVGAFPPRGGTPHYLKQKELVESDEPWFEYHIDFLPEELVLPLSNSFNGL